MKGKILIGMLLVAVMFFFCPTKTTAAEDGTDVIDYTDIDEFLQQSTGESKSFSKLVSMLFSGSFKNTEEIKNYIQDLLFAEVNEIKSTAKELVAMLICFALLNQLVGVMERKDLLAYNYYIFYLAVAVVLFRNFILTQGILKDAVTEILDFMKSLLPVFCVSIGLSTGQATSLSVYSLVLFVVYFTEWLFLQVGIPFLQVLLVFEFANYAMGDGEFSKMTELLKSAGTWFSKAAITFVLGINVIQGMIVPNVDKLKNTTVLKSMEIIPGIGKTMGTIGQVMIGSGAILKNAIGAAGMILLMVLMAEPVIKIGLTALCLKVIGAVFEPVMDKRMTGLVSGAGDVAVLMTRMIASVIAIFMLSLAVITTVTGGNL